MNTSKFLSKAMGIYLLIVGLAMLLNTHHFMNLVDSIMHDAPLLFVTGFFTFIVGILLVLSHNIWQWHWRTLVTVLAWIVFLKGASLILFPQFIDNLTHLFLRNMEFAYYAACIDFILGLVLCYFGFKR